MSISVAKEETRKTLKIIGKSIPRVDALQKVTGQAIYADDLVFPNMLYGKVLHASVPHAKILSIDTSPAYLVDGVVSIVTGKDIPGVKTVGFMGDQQVIAVERVKYVGDVVAVVAAVTEKIAEKATKKIRVRYENLPAVFDPERALEKDAPKVCDAGNLLNYMRIRKGDIKAGLGEADYVIKRRFKTPFIDQAPLEPHSVVVVPQGNLFVVYASTQDPFLVRDFVAATLGIKKGRVRVFQMTVGGGFGAKFDMPAMIATRAALLAQKTGRPVKITYTREEMMYEGYKRHPFIIDYLLGISKEGRIVASKVRLVIDAGAYASLSTIVQKRATIHSTGPYEIPNIEVDSYLVYTNNHYTGAMRGFGMPQVNFATESIIDEAAYVLKMDPIEFRLKNVLKDGSITATGQKLDTHKVSLESILKRLAKMSNWRNKREEYSKGKNEIVRRGIGVACGYHGQGLGRKGKEYAAAYMRIEQDGSVIVTSGITEIGQGMNTVNTQVVAETLGISPVYISAINVDTGVSPESITSAASRGVWAGASAVFDAARKLKQKLVNVAAEILETYPENIDSRDDVFFNVSNPSKKISYVDLVKESYSRFIELNATGWFLSPSSYWDSTTGLGEPYPTYIYGGNVAEVEVNTKTGDIRVVRVYAVYDCGRVINLSTAKGQVYGGVVMSMGFALKENFVVGNGYPKTLNFDTYHLVRANEAPEIIVDFIQNPDSTGPYGAKGLGEPANEHAAPAILNAVFHATGIRILETPATRAKILSALTNPSSSTKES